MKSNRAKVAIGVVLLGCISLFFLTTAYGGLVPKSIRALVPNKYNPFKIIEKKAEPILDVAKRPVDVVKDAAHGTAEVVTGAKNAVCALSRGDPVRAVKIAAGTTNTLIQVGTDVSDATIEIVDGAGTVTIELARDSKNISLNIANQATRKVLQISSVPAAMAVEVVPGGDEIVVKYTNLVDKVTETAGQAADVVLDLGTTVKDETANVAKTVNEGISKTSGVLNYFVQHCDSYPAVKPNTVEDISDPLITANIDQALANQLVGQLLSQTLRLPVKGKEGSYLEINKGDVKFDSERNAILVNITEAKAKFDFLKRFDVSVHISGTLELHPRIERIGEKWYLQMKAHLPYLNIDNFPNGGDKAIANLIEDEIGNKMVVMKDITQYTSFDISVDGFMNQHRIGKNVSQAILIVQEGKLYLKAK